MAGRMAADNYGDHSLPPWERKTPVQVPYFAATAPSLSDAERDALPSLLAVQTNNVPKARPRVDTHTRYGSNSSQRRGPYADDSWNTWGVNTPQTAPSFSRPYDSPVYIPPAPKSTPNPPTFTKPPPTPPDSDYTDYGSFKTTSTSESPPTKQQFKALPQIPTYAEVHGYNEATRPSRPRKAASLKQTSRLRRWKIALKEMFASQPVDETNLVHISAQGHWTDD